ncbi:hypothetical protein [Foetidibacter luteolus]|uniref:hypothetical protein n=1 Tax=Foetidibacter luteolus TaxID=2608880 RepID=UPI00129B354F|nr:hypothetical protein [Foetidibacter luteolus]
MKIVVTEYKQEDNCKCQFCDTIVAKLTEDAMIPSAEECYKSGNVPVPNFGWFCSQDCATKYEKKYDIKFARTSDGKVDYYADGF